MAAAHHQIEVVKLRAGVGEGGLDDSMPGVVDEHHHVRALQGGTGAYLGAGRHALGHGALRGAYEALAAGRKVILLQVHAGQQALAEAGGRLPPREHEALWHGHAHSVAEVDAHGAVDLAYAVLALFQVYFRQHDVQGRGRIADKALDIMPVTGLRGKLVTGHHSPLFIIQPMRRKEYLPVDRAMLLSFMVSLRKRGKPPRGELPSNVSAQGMMRRTR